MIKVLFMIHDLGQGGAEKVLVNLVNNMDRTKFDISVISLFGGGVNEQYLEKDIHYRTIFPKAFPGNSKVMKLFSPTLLHRLFVKEKYDIEISYLEGPSARIISGCDNSKTKLVSWIHSNQKTMKEVAASFRSQKEAIECYNRYDRTICVSNHVKNNFCRVLDYRKPCDVLYNVIESDIIRQGSIEKVTEFTDEKFRIIAVGTLKPVKGFDRLLNVFERLTKEIQDIHLYILGEGPQRQEIMNIINQKQLDRMVTLLGYKDNPYKYVKNSDLFVCSSYSEGFSTAVTEALILGTPVCTVNVSGMNELLGENNEYGIIVDNEENALYQGIKKLLDDEPLLKHYAERATQRGTFFDKENTLRVVENMLIRLISVN